MVQCLPLLHPERAKAAEGAAAAEGHRRWVWAPAEEVGLRAGARPSGSLPWRRVALAVPSPRGPVGRGVGKPVRAGYCQSKERRLCRLLRGARDATRGCVLAETVSK